MVWLVWVTVVWVRCLDLFAFLVVYVGICFVLRFVAFCGFICFRYFGRLGLLFNLNFGFYCWGLLLWFVVGV